LKNRFEEDQFHLVLSKAEDPNVSLSFYPMIKEIGLEFSVDHTQGVIGFADSPLVFEERCSF